MRTILNIFLTPRNFCFSLPWLLSLFKKGAFRKNAEDIEVQILSPRSSMPSDLLFGPTQFSIVMIYVGLYQFMTIEGIVIISSIGIGDSIAPIIGKWFARHFYTINPLGSTKTMEGSIFGVFLGTVTSIYVFLYILRIPLLPLRIILSYSAIAAMVEATSPSNMDNLLIPLVIHFSMDRVQQWLPE